MYRDPKIGTLIGGLYSPEKGVPVKDSICGIDIRESSFVPKDAVLLAEIGKTPEVLGAIRKFNTGATRDVDETKHDFEGFVSPLVTHRFAEYMTSHRRQKDGTIRASDNWQKGIPLEAYIKSLVRHVEDLRLHWDGYGPLATESLEDSLCAIIFNANGFLFETLKNRKYGG
jgi:hypothetical protein